MGKESPQPDNSGVVAAQASAEAANKTYQLGEDQLAFAKDQWAHNSPLIDQIVGSNIKSQNQQADFSKTMQDAYTGTFLPLEKTYADQAQNWASPSQQAFNAGQAQAAVGNQMDSARNAAMEHLESFGIDPSSTRYAALDIGTNAQKGAAQAAAGTNAIQQTKLQGLGLEAGAIAAGQGNAGAAISATGASTGAGAGGTGAITGGMNSATTAMSAPSQWFNSGAANMGTYTNAVNGFNYAQNQSAQIANQGMAGFGSLAGGLMGMFEDGGPADGVIPNGAAPAPSPSPTPGGVVPTGASSSGGQTIDDVPARLTAGEFVIPRDVVQWEGEKSIYALIDKARQSKEKAAQRPDIGGKPGPAINAPPAFTSRPQLPVQQTSQRGVIPAGML